ncbi:hypothetical protein Tco_1291891 [Tanacetum coccineum]
MSTYLKNMAGYKNNQLKSKSYEEIQEMFDKEMKRVNTFVDMNTELVKSSETRTEGRSKRAGDELESDNSNKQKIDEHVEAEKDDDQEEAEMKKHIEIVKDDEVAIDAIPLAIKPPVIVKYKIVKEGKEDLETLWKLVKAKHGNTRPEDEYEIVLWGDMKIQKMNIKFRGGLLGLKDFKMILRVTNAKVIFKLLSIITVVLRTDFVTTAGEVVTTANVEVTTANAPLTAIDELTLAQTLIEIKAAKPKVVTYAATTTTTTRPKAIGVVVQEPTRPTMVEPEKPLKKKDQIIMDEEVARNLEAQLQAELEEEDRISRVKDEKENIDLLES